MRTLILKLAFFGTALMFAVPTFVIAEEFNPNYLLSDTEMQDWSCMDRSDIQSFLDDNGGYISRLNTEDAEGVRRSAADIIYQSAKQYQINPKYLLVKLQKEQSLITDPDPTQKQLDGATGYGISDSCGWSCDVYLRNKGFGKQVDSAAGIMRWYYTHSGEQSWIKQPNTSYRIDNTVVVPANNATAFLYTYTPHILGNKNFWTLWQRWFEQVYPDGSLVKTADSPEVYLIKNGDKHHITSGTALATRFNPNLILTVPASELIRYNVGDPISLPNFSILKHDTKYYLVDYDQLRPFASYAVVQKLGYHPDEIIEVTQSDISGYATGQIISVDDENPLGRLVRLEETGLLYYVNDDTFHPIFDELIAQINYPNLTEEPEPAQYFNNLLSGDPITFKNGIIFGITGSNFIYVTENGEKRHIASPEIFEGMGYKWENIVWINQFAGMSHENGQAIYLRKGASVTVADQSPVWASDTAMIRTPAADTQYLGDIFETDVDAYLVADYESGEVLAGKNIDVVRPMASLAKVMTGYRLMAHGLNLNRSVAYQADQHKSRYHRFRITEGEKVLNGDLLNAFLVSSLNTPAYMLVTGAQIELTNFVAGMNEQAENWQLHHTSFTDPAGTGLSNVTTAREYLTLYTKASKNSIVKEYLSKAYYEYDEVLDLDQMPHHFDYHSNDLVNEDDLGFNILSSKTGYLEAAGSELAMVVERPRDKKKLVIITMGNEDYTHRFDEPEALTQWALAKF